MFLALWELKIPKINIKLLVLAHNRLQRNEITVRESKAGPAFHKNPISVADLIYTYNLVVIAVVALFAST